MNLCKCGCGKEVTYNKYKPREYIYQHHCIGKKGWSRGLNKENNEGLKKISISKLGDKNPAKRKEVRNKISKSVKKLWENKDYLERHSRINSEITKKRIKDSKGQFYSYNRNSCKFFDELNKKYDLDIQHALNGGEKTFQRKDCSSRYSLDGYSSILKLNIEIDDKRHDKLEIKSKDIKRDIFLKSLGIKVVRINENRLKNKKELFEWIIKEIKDGE